jgi:hypothetical protein
MNRKNAALYLGLSVKTLATHATKGTGPRFIKRGRTFYFQNDLDQWLREGPPQGPPRRRKPKEAKLALRRWSHGRAKHL